MYRENKDKIILDLCGGTGAWSRAYITPEHIRRARSRCKLGAVVDVVTYKMHYGVTAWKGLRQKGIVVAKYPYFAVVQLPNGVLDSVLWVDMLLKGV